MDLFMINLIYSFNQIVIFFLSTSNIPAGAFLTGDFLFHQEHLIEHNSLNATTALIPSTEFKVVRNKGLDTIQGNIKWQHSSDDWIQKYKLTMKSASESDRCRLDFNDLERNISRYENEFKIPVDVDHQPLHILKYRCSYTITMSTIPCNGSQCYYKEQNVTIPECINGTCECKVSAVQNLTVDAANDAESDGQNLTIEWNYPLERSTYVDKFQLTLKEGIKENLIIRNFTVNSKHIDNIDGGPTYKTWLNFTKHDGIHVIIVEVSAFGLDGCRGDLTKCEVFSQNWQDNPRRMSTDTIMVKTSMETIEANDGMSVTFIMLLLASSAITVMLIGGVSLLCRRRYINKRQHLHSFPKNLIKYKLPSYCKNSSSYFFSRREDINALYVEQEIQEAIDKGIVDHYEISPKKLIIGKEIGEGAFGRVCVATLESTAGNPKINTVAVKYLRDCPDEYEKNDFLREIEVMKRAVRHPNVINLIACCTIRQPICMIMEYAEHGDLLNYLLKLRSEYQNMKNMSMVKHMNVFNATKMACTISPTDASDIKDSSIDLQYPSGCSKATTVTNLSIDSTDSSLTGHINSKTLLSFALQIARGMIHLGSRGIVHRDLAARNVLIAGDMALKISDFGLSRTGIYVKRGDGKVPLRWLSIEAIGDNLYSVQSDVWAYGVVLWEICTLGGRPYHNIANSDVYKYLLNNGRLQKPSQCSDKMYSIMTKCWNADPLDRPNFEELTQMLMDMEQEPHLYVNFNIKQFELSPTEENN